MELQPHHPGIRLGSIGENHIFRKLIGSLVTFSSNSLILQSKKLRLREGGVVLALSSFHFLTLPSLALSAHRK